MSTARILVIGGRGFYGARVVDALRALGDVEPVIAGRGGPVVLDLCDPSSFAALDPFTTIVNASDSVGAPPDAAVAYAMARGATWLDMGADAETAARLLAVDADRGALVVGVGIFPGISTALAALVATESTRRIDFGVRISPLSGSGPGNCALVTHMLEAPGFRYRDGERVSEPAVGPGTALPFPTGDHVALQAAFPDTALIAHQSSASDVTSHIAVIPGLLRFNFMALGWLVGVLGPLKRPFLWMIEWNLRLLRGLLLRRVESPVEMVLIADRGTPAEQSRGFRVEDGQTATALGVAAAVRCLLDGGALAPGVYTAPQAFGAQTLIDAFELILPAR